jgi:hypothetical protein
MISYSAEVLHRLFFHYHMDLWPLALVTLAFGVLLLVLALRPSPARGVLTLTVLAAFWVFCGAVFHMTYLAELDPLSWIAGALFILQGVLSLRPVLFGPKPSFGLGGTPANWFGLALALGALLAYPLIAFLHAPTWQESPTFGITPASLSLFTLGVLLMARARIPLHLLVIPLLAALQTGITAWVLGLWQDLPLLALPPLAIAFALAHNRRHPRPKA